MLFLAVLRANRHCYRKMNPRQEAQPIEYRLFGGGFPSYSRNLSLLWLEQEHEAESVTVILTTVQQLGLTHPLQGAPVQITVQGTEV